MSDETPGARLRFLLMMVVAGLVFIAAIPVWLVLSLGLTLLSPVDIPIWVATGRRPITRTLGVLVP